MSQTFHTFLSKMQQNYSKLVRIQKFPDVYRLISFLKECNASFLAHMLLTSPVHKPSLLATSYNSSHLRSIFVPMLKALDMFLNPAEVK